MHNMSVIELFHRGYGARESLQIFGETISGNVITKSESKFLVYIRLHVVSDPIQMWKPKRYVSEQMLP